MPRGIFWETLFYSFSLREKLRSSLHQEAAPLPGHSLRLITKRVYFVRIAPFTGVAIARSTNALESSGQGRNAMSQATPPCCHLRILRLARFAVFILILILALCVMLGGGARLAFRQPFPHIQERTMNSALQQVRFHDALAAHRRASSRNYDRRLGVGCRETENHAVAYR